MAGGGYGARVRAERERRGWTRAELAEKIGGKEVTVKRIEGRPNPPKPSRLVPQITRVLGVTPMEGETPVAADDLEMQARQLPDTVLVSEVARRMAARLPVEHDQSNVRSFEVAGMSFDEQSDDPEVTDGPA